MYVPPSCLTLAFECVYVEHFRQLRLESLFVAGLWEGSSLFCTSFPQVDKGHLHYSPSPCALGEAHSELPEGSETWDRTENQI